MYVKTTIDKDIYAPALAHAHARTQKGTRAYLHTCIQTYIHTYRQYPSAHSVPRQ